MIFLMAVKCARKISGHELASEKLKKIYVKIMIIKILPILKRRCNI